ncbi:GRAM domain-containing protein [Caldibacillus lycopersici]|uniref:GRAM domain-containing protein n=1 Tax=Perspicuibacillus lycopersici TaxID=1325689 RepID=A0AAE3LQ78_9BACI|nr:GRAM domain-containing protein [Perspicuibacillus lycopersici]MCU9613164.1 GRAM domain-containing protein [Perspicuibacillus lycopersici]
MYCAYCGQLLGENYKFCTSCGNEVAATVDQTKAVQSTEMTGETVLVNKVPANLFRGIESVGGRLTITNKRVLFQSHKINIQSGATEILISDIAAVVKRNTLGLVPNGISIVLKNGTEYKLVVYKRDKLIKTIVDGM